MADDLRTISLEVFLDPEGTRKGSEQTKKYLEELGDTAKKFGRDFENDTDHATKAITDLGAESVKFFTAWASVDNLISGLRTVNQLVMEGTEQLKEYNEVAERFRKANTEYAGIVGRVPDKQFLEEQLQLQMATGANQQQASDFMKGFTNEGQLAIGVNISPEEARKYQELMLRWTVSRNMDDPERVGSIAGALLRKGDFKGPGGGEKAFNEAAQAVEVLNIGSGDMTAIMKQSNQVWQQLGSPDDKMGIFRNFGEAAFAVSLAAQTNDRRAWTGIEQGARAIRDFDGEFAPTLEEAGIKPEDSFIDSLAKFSAWSKKAVKEEDKPLDLILQERGLADEHARISLSGMAQNFDLETTQKQLELLRKDPAVFGADAKKDIQAFDNAVGGDLRAQQVNEASKIRKGMEGWDLERFRNLAEADLREGGLIDSDKARFFEWVTSATSLGTVGRDQVRQDVIDRRAAEMMADEAQAAGLQSFKMPGHGPLPIDQFASAFSNMQPEQKSDAAVEILKQIKDQQAEMIKAIREQKEQKGAPRALPGPREISSSSF